jgi:hypothetical protein
LWLLCSTGAFLDPVTASFSVCWIMRSEAHWHDILLKLHYVGLKQIWCGNQLKSGATCRPQRYYLLVDTLRIEFVKSSKTSWPHDSYQSAIFFSLVNPTVGRYATLH